MLKKVYLICATVCMLLTLPGMSLADYPNACGSAYYLGTVPLSPSYFALSDLISPAGDQDWYYVYVPAGRRLTVYTTGSTDTYGYLANNTCSTILAQNDDASYPTNTNFRIDYNVTTAGYYRIGVRHYNSSSGTGSYTLIVTSTALVTDDYAGTTCEFATNIGTVPDTGYISRAGVINFGGDQDWFRVYVPAGRTLRVYTSGSTDTYGILATDGCTTLASNDDESSANRNFLIQYNVTTSGYYRIGVRHYNASAGTGSYTLYVSAPLSDDWPNSCATASYIGSVPLSPSYLYRTGAINFAGDWDYFRVYVPAGRRLIVYTMGSTDTYGVLYSDGCSVLAYNDDTSSTNKFQDRVQRDKCRLLPDLGETL
jgi:hypothetical protein